VAIRSSRKDLEAQDLGLDEFVDCEIFDILSVFSSLTMVMEMERSDQRRERQRQRQRQSRERKSGGLQKEAFENLFNNLIGVPNISEMTV
jgi:hypothetical protein